MEETQWENYGTGNYEKCADCMVHCGYEATAVSDTITHPLKALRVFLFGIRTQGVMAPEIPLNNQRPAEFNFKGLVKTMTEKREQEDGLSKAKIRSQAASDPV